MNKRGILLCVFGVFFAILFISLISATSIEMEAQYQGKETMVIEVKGNLLENIGRGQIEFKRDNVRVPLEFDVRNIEGRTFIWAISPDNERNYTLYIEDVKTTENGQPVEVDLNKTFNVQGQIDYNIKPGFIVSEEDFEIEVNSFVDEPVVLEINYLEQSSALIEPGQNSLKFSIDRVQGKQILDIGIGQYVIPALIFGEGSEVEERLPEFRFKPKRIDSVIIEGETYEYPVRIINSGDKKIILNLEYNEVLFTLDNKYKEIEVEQNNEVDFNFTLKEFPEEEINETIIAKYGDETIYLPINIIPTKNESEVETPYLEDDFNENSLYYCSELEGTVCTAGETCQGESTSSLDGLCCLATCKVQEEEGSFSYIGWLIALVVVIILVIVFVKYKKTRVNKDEDFQKRLKNAERNTKMP